MAVDPLIELRGYSMIRSFVRIALGHLITTLTLGALFHVPEKRRRVAR
jgi:hypothetical protein